MNAHSALLIISHVKVLHFGWKVLSLCGKIELFLFIFGEMQSVLIHRNSGTAIDLQVFGNVLSRHNVKQDIVKFFEHWNYILNEFGMHG